MFLRKRISPVICDITINNPKNPKKMCRQHRDVEDQNLQLGDSGNIKP